MKAYIHILRPFNLFITAFSSFIAYYLVSGGQLTFNTFLVILATTFAAGAGNIVNDIFDFEIDKINKPNRPLPSGKMSIKFAWLYYFFTAIIAQTAAYFLGFISFTAVFIVNSLLLFYASNFKRIPILGNIVVAGISGYLFYFSVLTLENKLSILPLAICATLFHLSREIIKDIADVEGDKADEAATIATKFGIKFSAISALIVLTALLLYLVNLILFSGYSRAFHVLILCAVIPVILYVSYELITTKKEDSFKFEKLSSLMKYSMFAGIAAFFFGMH